MRVLEVRDVEAMAGKSLRYHVTVQVVPREVCCGGFLHRTTTVTHCPASFYETFELFVSLKSLQKYLGCYLLFSRLFVSYLVQYIIGFEP